MASLTAVNTGENGKDATSRALFRQPLALQWYENGEKKTRVEGERQAGPLSNSYYVDNR